jgi:hypothetical protein
MELVGDIVPAVKDITVERCSFSTLDASGVELIDVKVRDCDMAEFRLADCTWRKVTIENDVERLRVSGRVSLEHCRIGPGVEQADIEASARLTLRNCEVDRHLLDQLTERSRLVPHAVELISCREFEEPAEEAQWSRGVFFLAKLMSLARKHRHREYAVFGEKLRGRTGTSSSSYNEILAILRHAGAVELLGEMVCLTPDAVKWRFSGKARPGLRSYEEVMPYWGPIVEELDAVFR